MQTPFLIFIQTILSKHWRFWFPKNQATWKWQSNFPKYLLTNKQIKTRSPRSFSPRSSFGFTYWWAPFLILSLSVYIAKQILKSNQVQASISINALQGTRASHFHCKPRQTNLTNDHPRFPSLYLYQKDATQQIAILSSMCVRHPKHRKPILDDLSSLHYLIVQHKQHKLWMRSVCNVHVV